MYIDVVSGTIRLSGGGSVVASAEATPEERLATVEAEVRRVAEQLGHVEDAVRDAAGRARGEAQMHAEELVRDLRSVIAETLRSGRSLVGVAFFLVGAVLSAWANLV